MATIEIESRHLNEISALDAAIKMLNNEKIRVIFEVICKKTTDAEMAMLLDWDLIPVTVPDLQMAAQLNKLAAYVPNLTFVADTNEDIFTLLEGTKGRRVWKER